jgi:hypothetical protein
MAGGRKDLQPKHDGGSSITQDSYGTNNPGRPGKKPYVSGAKAGSGGAKPGGVGIAEAAGPKSGRDGT